MNKKKICRFGCVSLATTLVLGVGLIGVTTSEKILNAEKTDYSVTWTKAPTAVDGNLVFKTNLGNDVVFKATNQVETTTAMVSLNAGGTLANLPWKDHTGVGQIKKITLEYTIGTETTNYDPANGNILTLQYGYEADDTNVIKYTKSESFGTTKQFVDGHAPAFVKFTNNSEKVINITKIQIAYGCTSHDVDVDFDQGALKDNVFEFESAIFSNPSKNQATKLPEDPFHQCIANSLSIHPEFSGNAAIKNMTWAETFDNTFSFTFNSDKEVKAEMVISMANRRHGEYLKDFITITNNGIEDTDYNNQPIPELNGHIPTGLNPSYFTMVDVPTSVHIYKGSNTLSFKVTNPLPNIPNLDCVTIKTSANLENTTTPSLDVAAIGDNSTITTWPTETTNGELSYKCGKPGCNNVDKAILPALNSGKYTKDETNADLINWNMKIGETTVDVLHEAKLTILDGNGKVVKTEMHKQDTDVTINHDFGKKIIGFVNANNPDQKFDLTFKMSKDPLTVKPLFDGFNLTVVDATFTDGTTTKKFDTGSEVTMNVTAPEGKKLIGWMDVNTKKYYAGATFITEKKDMTIKPIFDVTTYASKTNAGNITTGKLQTYPMAGVHGWDFGGTEGFIKKGGTVNYKGGANETWGLVKDENGVYEHGSIFNLSVADKTQDAHLMFMNPYQVINGHTYKITYVVENLGDEGTYTIATTNSSGSPTESMGTPTLLKHGESFTGSHQFGDKYSKPNNNLIIVIHAKAGVSAIHVGIRAYIDLIK